MFRVRLAALAALFVLAPTLSAQHAHHAAGPAADAEGPPPLFDNLGSYSKRISTRDSLAQRYFDQGVRLMYGFNHMEAMLAFQEAARRDPRCAICEWGVASSFGPDINQDMNEERWRAANAAILRARDAMQHASAWERRYVEASLSRFDPLPDFRDPAEVRRLRVRQDSAYAESMGQLAADYPDDPDAATWYAESLLDLAPWNQWSPDGRTPRAGTLDAVAALERVIARWPDHPGANHFYIHAVEASSRPDRALRSAKRLAELIPGASHIVHMPSHIYLRAGRYHDAAQANRAAVRADSAYLRVRQALGRYPRYFAHNLEFLWSAAGMAGMREVSLAAARDQSAEWPADSVRRWPNTQHFLVTPWVVMVRFGMWKEMLDEPPPPADLSFALGAWHYARGFAELRSGRPDTAFREWKALEAIIGNASADSVPAQSINSGRELLRLAAATLEGEILAERGDADAAIGALECAVAIQDRLRYDEPPPFYFPARHSLGAVLLRFGRPAEAERVYRTDLAHYDGLETIPNRNRLNGWSLLGLALALEAQGKRAAGVRRQFRKAWQFADVEINGSRF
ncbi:MAG TPA: tetratricopeptide repeat protein [Longimicrobiaceae bacterium]|jgi:tetratricopeptide (TPR) repeat protein